ncbi:MAG TPA: hypothetical protein VLG74_10185 [Blastocatellia bacterium]|nr:hypothetical protein [Blastocatellia bacterium]
MNMKRFLLTLVIAAVAAPQMPVVCAQSAQRARRADVGWAGLARSGNGVSVEQQSESDQELQIAESAAIEPFDVDPKKRIVGTWVMTVSPSDSPAFTSLQTYNDDGTMTETSSLLHQGVGPAHGVWEGKKSDYAVSFELFAFDPSGGPVGRLRVRGRIRMSDNDTLTADGVVDFIQPDGTVIPNVASTPFTGTRIKLVPAN